MLITGASGKLGTATIEFLLQKTQSNNVAALIRDVTNSGDLKSRKLDVRTADYDNPEALARAFRGVEKILLISGNDVGKRLQQHKNVVDAAREAGVSHIIYTSIFRKSDSDTSIKPVVVSHAETEKYIRASGLNYTIMLNTLYADMLPVFFGDKVFETGIFLPAGNGKASFASRRDMAEAAACILTGEGHENKEYVIANTYNYSLDDIAAILSEIAGHQVQYLNPSPESYNETLRQMGVPGEIVMLTADFAKAIKKGELETVNTDFVSITGRNPESMEEFLRKVYKP